MMFYFVIALLGLLNSSHAKSPTNEKVSFLKKIVNMSSDSKDAKGVNSIQDLLDKKLKKMGFTTQQIQKPNVGNLLVAEYKGQENKFITILAHSDTVFPKSTGFFKFSWDQKSDLANGPGIIDAKGGLVIALSALEDFLKQNKPRYSLRFISSPNEEVGSTEYLDLFKDYSKDSVVVLGMEPALPEGNIVTSRRGDRWYHIKVKGVEAHAGRDHGKGVNACHELAIKIAKIHEFTNYDKNVTVSIGNIQGGKDKYAIVCGTAEAKLDVRFADEKNRSMILEKIEEVLKTTYVSSPLTQVKATTEYKIVDDPLPFSETPASLALAKFYTDSVKKIEGKEIQALTSGGSADSNFFQREGLIIIDGLGPKGRGMHTIEEEIELPSLETRTVALKELLQHIQKQEF